MYYYSSKIPKATKKYLILLIHQKYTFFIDENVNHLHIIPQEVVLIY